MAKRLTPLVAAVTAPIRRLMDARASDGVYPNEASEAWMHWRTMGELHYATSFMARQVGRLAWDVVINGTKLERAPNRQWPAILEGATFPEGVRDTVEDMTLQYLVPGAFHYVRVGEEWQVTATTTPGLNELEQEANIWIRAINPDPEKRGRADSPVLANLNTIRELALLQALQRSQSRNRIAQRGILMYPAEAEFPDDTNFEKDFEEAATAPIRDEYAAEAVTPLILKYPEALIEKWRHLVLENPYDEELPAKIESVTRRLAIGLDMPPEALLGMGDATHWTVWNVSESTYRAHMEPWATEVGRVLARAILRMSEEPIDVQVIPDPTPVLAKLGSVTDGFEAYDRHLVNGEFVRSLMGATEDDAPEDEDLMFIDPAGMPPRIRRLSSDRSGPPAERPALPGQPRPSAPPGARGVVADGETEESRELAEIVQKVYLGVVNNVLTASEARQLLRRAGWTDLPLEFPTSEEEPVPEQVEVDA